MIYKHTRTGGRYRVLLHSFSVERQEHSVVYMNLETGQIFDRALAKFAQNFELDDSDVQGNIVPKEPHL